MEEHRESHRSDSNNFLAGSVLISALLISASIIYSTNTGKGAPRENAPALQPDPAEPAAQTGSLTEPWDGDVVLGQASAPVSIVEYGDYQCPFCGRFFNQIEQKIRREYIETGKAKMVYRDLAFLGDESVQAAAAAMCARDQGKFWPYHDALFTAEILDGAENNGNLNETLFLKLGKESGLDDKTFGECVKSKKYVESITQETSKIQSLGVNATPTTYVNDTLVRGAVPYEEFKAAVEAEFKGK